MPCMSQCHDDTEYSLAIVMIDITAEYSAVGLSRTSPTPDPTRVIRS